MPAGQEVHEVEEEAEKRPVGQAEQEELEVAAGVVEKRPAAQDVQEVEAEPVV